MRPLPPSPCALALSAVFAAACDRRPATPPPSPAPAAPVDAPAAAATPEPAAPSPSGIPAVDAGPPAVLIVRLRNVDTAPLRILTNPDLNEMIRVQRVNVSADTSDRAAHYADGSRVSLEVRAERSGVLRRMDAYQAGLAVLTMLCASAFASS